MDRIRSRRAGGRRGGHCPDHRQRHRARLHLRAAGRLEADHGRPQGPVTLVNFWATSCVTCVAEMPRIVATYNKYNARGFDTLALP
jgi:thiol-disulfide isomerase/thioredoxin